MHYKSHGRHFSTGTSLTTSLCSTVPTFECGQILQTSRQTNALRTAATLGLSLCITISGDTF